MRIFGVALIVTTLFGCASNARYTPELAQDPNEGPSRSRLYDLEVDGSGTVAARPAAGPVRVALFRTNVARALRGDVDEARLHALWRAQFQDDASVRLVTPRDGDAVAVTSVASRRADGGMLLSARVGERTVMVRGKAGNYPGLVRRLAADVKRVLRDR